MKRTSSHAAVCFRGATDIDVSLRAIADSERALLEADDEASRRAAEALRVAREQLLKAREALQVQAGLRSAEAARAG